MSKQKKFEENLAELETIVQSLENGEIALEDAIAAFQKGMVLSKELQATLDKAEKTLVKVMQEDGTESDFEWKSKKKLALVESALEDFYGDQQFASSLRESVLYSIHAGGKRIRPFLLLEVLEALQVTIKPAHAQVLQH